jgi:hypothetical protein
VEDPTVLIFLAPQGAYTPKGIVMAIERIADVLRDDPDPARNDGQGVVPAVEASRTSPLRSQALRLAQANEPE